MVQGMDKVIPVVFALDDIFVKPGCVAIWSMLTNSCKEMDYEIIILHSAALSLSGRQALLEEGSLFSNCRLQFIKIDDGQFGQLNLKEGITASSVLRLMAGELLPQYEKCLYLDSDIIVMDDIAQLYHQDLEDAYIAAVKDAGIQYYYEQNCGYADVIGINDMKEYINSGILVMNLTALRRDNMAHIFLNYINEKYNYLDQDILNKCCSGHIKYLPIKYNLFRRFYHRLSCLQGTDFTERELEEADAPVILHYAEGLKPWDCLKGNASDIWWEYAEKALPAEQYRICREETEQAGEEFEWKRLVQWAVSKRQVIVFGYSTYGREAVRILHNLGVANIVAFCDNDPEKQGLQYEGVCVKNLLQITKEYSDAAFINTSQKQRGNVEGLLLQNGYVKENIWAYDPVQFRKSNLYYGILDPKFYKDELKGILMQETGIETDDFGYMIQLVRQEDYEGIRTKYYMQEWVLGQ